MSCRQHGYPLPSLATSPYHSSLLAGFQVYIPYPHIAAVCMFELVVQLLLWPYAGVQSNYGNKNCTHKEEQETHSVKKKERKKEK